MPSRYDVSPGPDRVFMRGLRGPFIPALVACIFALGVSTGSGQEHPAREVELRLLRSLHTQVDNLQGTRFAVTPDGLAVAADPLEQTLWIFPSDSGVPARIGGRGQGPGEFGLVAAIGLVGDSVWAADLALRRLSVFLRDGALVRDEPLPMLSSGSGRVPVVPRALLPDGRMIAVLEPALRPSERAPETRAFLLSVAASGARVDTLLSTSRQHSLLIVRGSVIPSEVRMPQPFDDSALWGFSHRPQSVVVVDRHWHGALPGEVRILRVTLDGDTIARAVVRYAPHRLGRGTADSVANVLASGPERFFRSRRDALARIRPLVYLPALRPPVVGMHVGVDGVVWLRSTQEVNARTRWDLLNADLAHIRFAWLGSDEMVVHASGDRVWVFTPGEDGNTLREYQVPAPD